MGGETFLKTLERLYKEFYDEKKLILSHLRRKDGSFRSFKKTINPGTILGMTKEEIREVEDMLNNQGYELLPAGPVLGQMIEDYLKSFDND
jgi:hypothetical protein